jgi:hypothetical protein
MNCILPKPPLNISEKRNSYLLPAKHMYIQQFVSCPTDLNVEGKVATCKGEIRNDDRRTRKPM